MRTNAESYNAHVKVNHAPPRVLTGVRLTIQGTLTTAILSDILTLQMTEI